MGFGNFEGEAGWFGEGKHPLPPSLDETLPLLANNKLLIIILF